MTRRTLLTIAASPLLRASDPFEDRWRAAVDRLIGTPPESVPFTPADGVLMTGLMRLYQRTRYPLYADFVEGWARHHLARAPQPNSANGLAILLLHEARPHASFDRYAGQAVASAEASEGASLLARFGMTRGQPGLVLRAARGLRLDAGVTPELLLRVGDVLEALEPMQPEYEPLAVCAQAVRPVASDLLTLAAAWKLVRIQVVPAVRAADAFEQWKIVHGRGGPPANAAYILAAAEAAATL